MSLRGGRFSISNTHIGLKRYAWRGMITSRVLLFFNNTHDRSVKTLQARRLSDVTRVNVSQDVWRMDRQMFYAPSLFFVVNLGEKITPSQYFNSAGGLGTESVRSRDDYRPPATDGNFSPRPSTVAYFAFTRRITTRGCILKKVARFSRNIMRSATMALITAVPAVPQGGQVARRVYLRYWLVIGRFPPAAAAAAAADAAHRRRKLPTARQRNIKMMRKKKKAHGSRQKRTE